MDAMDLVEREIAMEELLELCGELEFIQEKARELLEHFPEALQQADAYGVLQFGASSNPYDVTFRAIVAELEKEHGTHPERMAPTV